ncbi:MAG: bifunctional demethylmenaquinone methyltransferase/2-methoxy-6-polyprenyl,4-benzoquinol methylase [Bacteroidota bacterium]|jgi:demethylmenaquinone methyltransferase/2-methoxy-6-polyprenyl-1,4-benzoquinol methylase
MLWLATFAIRLADYKHNTIVPYEGSDSSKKQQVEQMFDDIAPRYDFLNRFMSLGIDVLWRKRVVCIMKQVPQGQILDVATGTADLAIMLSKNKQHTIVGLDLSKEMLAKGQEKIEQQQLTQSITLVKGDAEHLPYSDNTFIGCTVAFGVRNFQDLDAGLKEIYRVLQPGATFVILEFSKVKKFPIKQLFGFYFRYITPIFGKLLSSKAAYNYLPQSVAAFPEGDEMLRILHQVGFKHTTCTSLSFGISSIYTAEK